MERKICVVSAEHDAIDWLVYQLMSHSDVKMIDFKTARMQSLRHFDWVIFDVGGHSLTEKDVTTKIGGHWLVGRAIIRLDLATSRVQQIVGTKFVSTDASASAFLDIMQEVRA